MNQFIQKNKNILAIVAVCLLIGCATMSFQDTPFGPINKLDTLTDLQDTVPEKIRESDLKMSIRDYDQLIQNMDNEMIKMQKGIKEIDVDKIQKEIAISLNKVDFDKLKVDIDKAMRDIDFLKIEKGINAALKEIDWNTLNNNVKISLQDARKEIQKINVEAVKKEMEKAKIEMEKSRNKINKINIDEIIKNANAGINKAKIELRLTKNMFNEMEKEGLINQKEGFTIEYKDKSLIINGKKQSEAITEKYRHYIKRDEFKISIDKE